MLSTSTLLTLLTAANSAVATTPFGLRAFSTRNRDIVSWAVVNEHLGAGQNYLAVQRPSAYQPDKAIINGTAQMKEDGTARLAFRKLPHSRDGIMRVVLIACAVLDGVDYPYEARIPRKPVNSDLVRVLTEPGEGSHRFGLSEGKIGTDEVDLLAFDSEHGKSKPTFSNPGKGRVLTAQGFWICPETIYESVGEEFVLYYGIHPTKAGRPSPKCMPVRLQAGAL